MQKTEPVFIIGNPRAGTTLLRLMLTCHPCIHIPPECGFAVWLRHRFGNWRAADSDARLDSFLEALAGSRKFETWNLPKDKVRACIAARNPSSYSELVGAVYTCHAAAQGKPGCRWGDKNNFHLNHILEIKALFPEARFVHIVRDPRDIACSYRELNRRRIDSPYQPKLADDVADIAAQWGRNIRIIRRSFESFQWCGVLEIGFEKLVLEAVRALKNVCGFLNEEYDPAMLGYHEVNQRCSLEPKEFLLWKERTLEPPRADRIGRFRQELSEREIRAVLREAGAEMALYNYS